jgi:hypothetical protein
MMPFLITIILVRGLLTPPLLWQNRISELPMATIVDVFNVLSNQSSQISCNAGRQGRQPGTEPRGWSASYRSVGNGPLPLVANFVKSFTISGVSNTEKP